MTHSSHTCKPDGGRCNLTRTRATGENSNTARLLHACYKVSSYQRLDKQRPRNRITTSKTQASIVEERISSKIVVKKNKLGKGPVNSCPVGHHRIFCVAFTTWPACSHKWGETSTNGWAVARTRGAHGYDLQLPRSRGGGGAGHPP